MDTHQLKVEVDKSLQKLTTLRDEARLKLHLATLEAKTEWDEKLAPRILDMESSAKNATEQSRSSLNELVQKVEQFVQHLRKTARERGQS
jgi:hypothetical protein